MIEDQRPEVEGVPEVAEPDELNHTRATRGVQVVDTQSDAQPVILTMLASFASGQRAQRR
jgi:hypothetical protein